jgi:hypothetical protein
MADGWLFPLATILLGSILLGLYAFSKPMTQMVQEDIPYEHQGEFSYQAEGAKSVYDEGKIETGDPIFHSLATSFDVTFDYSFSSPAANTTSGRYRLILRVSEPNGWRRETELVPSTRYSGNSFSTSATVDLTYVQSIVQELETKTGFKRLPYDVRIIPIIASEALIAGHPIVEQFSPSLNFKLDDYQLYLDGANPFEEESDSLKPVQAGMQPDFHLVPATLTILGLDFQVEVVRWIAGIAGIATLIGLGAILYPVIRSWQESESSRIKLQYPDRLLEVEKLPKIKAAQTIDVSSFSDLIKITQTVDALILHHEQKGTHTYLLQMDEGAYRYNLQDELEEDGG